MKDKKYTLLIVDDNQFVREAISQNISWQEFGIGTVHSAPNGQKALEIIENHDIDIVISDVLMPVLDGVGLAKEIRLHHPGIIIIFISAYNDFEYVQQAVKTDAFDYILKPVDNDILIKSVKAAISEKDMEMKLRHKIKSGNEFLTERFYQRLVEGKSGSINIKEDTEYLGIEFKRNSYTCVVLDIDEKEKFKTNSSIEDFELTFLMIREIIAGTFNDYEFHISNGENDTIVIIVGYGKSGFLNKLLATLEELQDELEKRCHITVTAGIGKEKSKIEDIRFSYREAKKAVEYRFMMGFGKILSYKDFELRNSTDNVVNTQESEEKLVKYLRLGVSEGFEEFLKNFISGIERKQLNREKLSVTVVGISIKVYQTVIEQNVVSEKFSADFIYKMYEELQKLQTREQLIGWLKTIIRNAFTEIDASRQNSAKVIINKIIDYVEKNYNMEELNLDIIAKEVSFSHSYISLLFKKETGMNLFDHIIKLRIEKASEMLCNKNIRIADIGVLVGYPNPSYFSNVFKKHTGMSPKEFRDQYENK